MGVTLVVTTPDHGTIPNEQQTNHLTVDTIYCSSRVMACVIVRNRYSRICARRTGFGRRGGNLAIPGSNISCPVNIKKGGSPVALCGDAL